MVHLYADIVQHVDDVLVVCLPIALLLLEHVCDSLKLLGIVCCLVESLQLLEPVADLHQDLAPLELVVLEIGLNFLHKSLLVLVQLLFLHAKGSLHVCQQVLRRKHLAVALGPPVFHHGSDVLLLEVKLPLHLAKHRVDAVDGGLQLRELRAHSLRERGLKLLQILTNVLVNRFVGVHAPLLLGFQYALDAFELFLDLKKPSIRHLCGCQLRHCLN